MQVSEHVAHIAGDDVARQHDVGAGTGQARHAVVAGDEGDRLPLGHASRVQGGTQLDDGGVDVDAGDDQLYRETRGG